MAAIGPVSLTEVRDVLADRLLSLEVEPPANRYGRVFVGSPHQASGRAFKVVFVPGLAERMFPQKLREDPLLLDDLRQRPRAPDLSLQRAIAPSSSGFCCAWRSALRRIGSTPPSRASNRPKPARACRRSTRSKSCARSPGAFPIIRRSSAWRRRSRSASLAWPAPADAADAIDDFEHDLAVLRRLMLSGDDVKGRAHYMLTLNDCLKRSVTERWARAEKRWSQFDGLVRVTDATRPFLQTQRLNARAVFGVRAAAVRRVSVSVLPVGCLSSRAARRAGAAAAHGPAHEGQPVSSGAGRVLPRACRRRSSPSPTAHETSVLTTLDDTLDAHRGGILRDVLRRRSIASGRTRSRACAPICACGSISLRRDPEWEPLALRVCVRPARAARTRSGEPARIRSRSTGGSSCAARSISSSANPGRQILRVTDHKTRKNRSQRRLHHRRGSAASADHLQPRRRGSDRAARSRARRFSYCTTAGGFTDHSVPINERTRRMGIEVLEIVDRAVELGMLPPAPNERACSLCDFLPVCGPDQERRANRKSKKEIADLSSCRGRHDSEQLADRARDRDLICDSDLDRHADRRSGRRHRQNHRARPSHRPGDRERPRRGHRDRLASPSPRKPPAS